MRVGDMRIDALIDGECVTPRGLMYTSPTADEWSEDHLQYLPACTEHQTLNTLGGYLVRYDDRVVLVDAGVGPQPTFPFVGGGLRSSLLANRVDPTEVTDVIFTHLHLDHIGWASVNGKPFFPHATYRCDKRDWDFFNSPDYEIPEWELAASNPEVDSAKARLSPVADRMEFFEGEQNVLPGIDALEAAGHTPGTTVLVLSSQGAKGALIGDLVHTEPELYEEDWEYALPFQREQSLASVKRIREYLFDNDIPFAGAHFAGMHWGKLTKTGDRFNYRQLPE